MNFTKPSKKESALLTKAPPERTKKNKEKIKSLWGPSEVIDDALDQRDWDILKEEISRTSFNIIQGRGNFQLNINILSSKYLNHVFKKVIEKKFFIKNFKIREINVFKLQQPYRIHTDAGTDAKNVPYKNFVLWLDGLNNQNDAGMILFKEYSYFSFSVFDDYEYNPNYLLPALPPCSFVEYGPGKTRNHNLIQSHLLKHIPVDVLSRFHVETQIPFKRNRMVMFDSCQFHCSSFFEACEKIGIMISCEYDSK